MSPPCAEHSLLAKAGLAAGCFLADRTRHVSLGALRAPPGRGFGAASCEGRAVLLAVRDQVSAAVALVQLAGVARRIVLWPRDEPLHRMGDVIEAAEVDVVITEWSLPGPDACASPSWQTGHSAVGATEWVLLTSGTTGRPKLVLHSLASLSGHIGRDTQGDDAVWCCFYDLCRYGGLQVLLRMLIGGGSLLLPVADASLDDFLAWAARSGGTHFVGTPTHWRKVLMSPQAGALRPRYIRLSGEVADQAILDRLHRTFPAARLVHAFATTEAGLAFEIEDGQAGVRPDVLAAPWRPGIISRVVEGSLQIRSSGAARGYLTGGRITPVAAPDGFVDTGDTLVLRHGRLHFDGRRDHVVNVGGRKVSPARVEAVLNEHAAVRMCRVLHRPSPVMGALVSAEVVCEPQSAVDAAERAGHARMLTHDILAYCRTRLDAHEVPATLSIVASLAVAPSGKLDRHRA